MFSFLFITKMQCKTFLIMSSELFDVLDHTFVRNAHSQRRTSHNCKIFIYELLLCFIPTFSWLFLGPLFMNIFISLVIFGLVFKSMHVKIHFQFTLYLRFLVSFCILARLRRTKIHNNRVTYGVRNGRNFLVKRSG